jgi:hypothetical protein
MRNSAGEREPVIAGPNSEAGNYQTNVTMLRLINLDTTNLTGAIAGGQLRISCSAPVPYTDSALDPNFGTVGARGTGGAGPARQRGMRGGVSRDRLGLR